MSARAWDIGDTAPPIDVTDVTDCTADTWDRVSAPDSEMVRRWGPVTEVPIRDCRHCACYLHAECCYCDGGQVHR